MGYTHQEFEKICLSARYTQANWVYIYQQVYSPKLIQCLELVGLQNPPLTQKFTPNFLV